MAYRRVKNIQSKHLTQLCASTVAIRWNDCTLWADGDRFVMASPKTGRHTLLIAATDAERLAAHWHGFAGYGQR